MVVQTRHTHNPGTRAALTIDNSLALKHLEVNQLLQRNQRALVSAGPGHRAGGDTFTAPGGGRLACHPSSNNKSWFLRQIMLSSLPKHGKQGPEQATLHQLLFPRTLEMFRV